MIGLHKHTLIQVHEACVPNVTKTTDHPLQPPVISRGRSSREPRRDSEVSCAEFPTHASHGWAKLDLLTAARVHLVIHQSISLFISLTEQHLICDPLALILKVHFLLSSQYSLFPVIAVLNISQLLFQGVSHTVVNITPTPTPS